MNFSIGLANAKTYAVKAMELIQSKKMDFGLATTRLDKWENAIDAFLMDTTKLVVTRDKIKIV